MNSRNRFSIRSRVGGTAVAVSVAALALTGVGNVATASPLAEPHPTPITSAGIDTGSSAPLVPLDSLLIPVNVPRLFGDGADGGPCEDGQPGGLIQGNGGNGGHCADGHGGHGGTGGWLSGHGGHGGHGGDGLQGGNGGHGGTGGQLIGTDGTAGTGGVGTAGPDGDNNMGSGNTGYDGYGGTGGTGGWA